MKKENFFLVTSAIKSLFPEKKEKILLLGEWCKCNLGNDFLNSYKVKVLLAKFLNQKLTDQII